MALFDMSYVISPTIASGFFSLVFNKFERVMGAVVSYDQSTNTSLDTSGGIDISFTWGNIGASTLNSVDVYPFVRNGTNGTRTAATTANLNGKKFVIIAIGS